ncbi:cyclin-dependent kinase 9-like [Acropora palmata]|uniref:cyclin-dependent kinase 9-like n=1 Tax=Acropora palmata TaxID=6131 RepID=UPI003DA1874B
MTFKMPCLTMKASIPRVTGLPSFKYEDLEEIAVVRQGSFGVVFKAKHRTEKTDTVDVKKLCESEEDEEDHKEFVKEARMLYNIQHDNVVKFKAFCQKPYAIMLEYVYFDFSVFGDECDKKVHSLREFLVFVDKEQVLEDLNECSVITKIAKDVANGLCYLHSKDIVHRDLKTANVLVSNQHYSNIASKEDVAKAFQEAPFCVKSPILEKAGHAWYRQHWCFIPALND